MNERNRESQKDILRHNKLIRMLRVWGMLIGIWPLDSKDGKFLTVSCKILWWLYIANASFELPAFIRSLFSSNDFIELTFMNTMKSIVEIMYTIELLFNIIYCKIQEKRLKKILSEIEKPDIYKMCTPYEEITRQNLGRYVQMIYTSLIVTQAIGTIAFIVSPIVSGMMLPFNTVYPFPLTELWGLCLGFGLNIFSLAQATVTICCDLMIITILWHVIFKFNLLGMQMRSIFSTEKLRAAIIAHQSVLSYVQEIDYILRYLIIKMTIVASIHMINCGLVILNNVRLVYIIIYFCIATLSILRLYFCSWLAEMMTDMAYNISWNIYDTPWIYTSPQIRRQIFIIIQRCQRPAVISGTCIIPTISVKFCGMVFYMTFSYFVTLRAILHL